MPLTKERLDSIREPRTCTTAGVKQFKQLTYVGIGYRNKLMGLL